MTMKPFHVGLKLLLALGCVAPLTGYTADEAAPRERIGVYDSRAVAVAYAGSPAHEKQLKQLQADHRAAKTAGDMSAVARLEAEGKARQQKAHKQAFSTAPVDDILKEIQPAVQEIQKKAGVTALISKWDAAELKRHAGAERVDVTAQLVDALQPNERQRKSALDIQKHEPISLEQAENIKD
jgi:hypothetical protein